MVFNCQKVQGELTAAKEEHETASNEVKKLTTERGRLVAQVAQQQEAAAAMQAAQQKEQLQQLEQRNDLQHQVREKTSAKVVCGVCSFVTRFMYILYFESSSKDYQCSSHCLALQLSEVKQREENAKRDSDVFKKQMEAAQREAENKQEQLNKEEEAKTELQKQVAGLRKIATKYKKTTEDNTVRALQSRFENACVCVFL